MPFSCSPLCDNCSIDPSFDVKDGETEMESSGKGKRRMIYAKGESIFNEGSKPSGVFCLKRGKIKIHKTGALKKEQMLRFAREGQLLGTRALIRNEYYTSSATTLEKSVLCFIPKQEFLSTLKKEVQLKAFVLKNMTNNLRIADDKIAHLTTSSAKQRLAIIILRLIEVYGYKEDGKTLAIELTREEMANLVGAVNETTIRLLSSFKKKRLIRLQGRSLRILKYSSIERLAMSSGK